MFMKNQNKLYIEKHNEKARSHSPRRSLLYGGIPYS